MKDKIILILFVLLIITGLGIILVNASIVDIGSVKLNDCITLPQTCNCTWNNITTIMYPNKSYITINQAMTQDGTYFNYTFCNTTVLGQYFVNGVGNKDGIVTPFSYYFLVTSTGYAATTSQSISMFIIIGILMLAIVLFFIFGISTRYIPAKIGCLSLSVLLIVFTVGYILQIANINLGEFTTITSGFSPLYVIFITLLIAGGIGILLYLIAFVFKTFQKTRYGIGE